MEINGTSVSEKPFPFIGFDTQEGRIYGNSGCNRIMGNFDLSSKSNKIELEQMASTMMACSNMELERNVFDALASVTHIKQAGKNKIALYQSGKKPDMLLQRRSKVVPLTDLQGEWCIIKIFNEALPVGIKTVPNLIFDIPNRKINGHAGCNRFMGGFQTKDGIKNSISFTGVGTTRMVCPDMQIENNLLAALTI